MWWHIWNLPEAVLLSLHHQCLHLWPTVPTCVSVIVPGKSRGMCHQFFHWCKRGSHEQWSTHLSRRNHDRLWVCPCIVTWAWVSRCSYSWLLLSFCIMSMEKSAETWPGGGVPRRWVYQVLHTEKCSYCFCPTQFCTCVMGWLRAEMPDNSKVTELLSMKPGWMGSLDHVCRTAMPTVDKQSPGRMAWTTEWRELQERHTQICTRYWRWFNRRRKSNRFNMN